jgi:hypothetical protein
MTLLRKIHTRELAKVLTSSIVVCFSRILGRRESPYVSFCECDITVRFVERLDYFMPRFSWHGSLS